MILRARTFFPLLFVIVGPAWVGCGGDTDPSGSGGTGGATTGSSTTGSGMTGSSTAGSGGAGGIATSGSTTGGTGGGTGGTGGGAGGTGGGTGGTGGSNLAGLSDTFDAAALDPSWTIFNPQVIDVTVAASALSIHVTQASLWYNASRGGLVYKLVSGDFKVTARVHARKSSIPADPPTDSIHLGGLMARDPAGEQPGGLENYVFIVLGRDANDLSVEVKTTVDSVSTYDGPTWPSGDAELRLCRIGAMFHLYKRPIGAGTWTLAASYDRPDLPGTLQVGANAYTQMTPDLVMSFDEIVFGEALGQADCESG